MKLTVATESSEIYDLLMSFVHFVTTLSSNSGGEKMESIKNPARYGISSTREVAGNKKMRGRSVVSKMG